MQGIALETIDHQQNRTSQAWQTYITIALAVLLLLGWLIRAGASSSIQQPAVKPAMVKVKVQGGDTLWSLARQYGDPDQYILSRIEQIRDMNHLASDQTLRPGQTLLIPTHDKNADRSDPI